MTKEGRDDEKGAGDDDGDGRDALALSFSTCKTPTQIEKPMHWRIIGVNHGKLYGLRLRKSVALIAGWAKICSGFPGRLREDFTREDFMRRVLLRRSHLQSSLDFIQNLIASRYIARKNAEFAHARGQRLAVYANDWIGAKIYLEGVYEKQNIEDLFDILQGVGIDVSGSTAIDVGANIGNHTVVFASKFARVEAFEPNPHTFKLLSFNADHLPNVALHNGGLGDETAVLTMSEDEANYGKSSAVHLHAGGSSVDIRVKKLDDYRDEFRDIKLIKIDVEGMEHQVLLGARGILMRDRPVVAFEQHETEFVAGERETPSIKYLRENGYDLMWSEVVGKDRPLLVRRLSNIYELFFGKTVKRVMVTDGVVPSASHSMLVAIPKERMEGLSAPGA